jgi:hypothetical protein
MKRLMLTCLLALGFSSWAAWGAEVDSHRQAARELLQAIRGGKVMMAAANTMLDAQIQSNPNMAPYRDVIQKWLEKNFAWEAIEPRITDDYVEAFTEPELREMIAFYKTPTGQKALAKMPVLMQKGALIGMEIVQQHRAELQEMIRARKEELEKAKKKPEGESAAPGASKEDLLRRANALFDSEKWAEAADAYTEYLKSAPGNVDALTDLGICYRQMSDFEGALRQLDRALALDSRHWKALYNKVIVLAFDLHRKAEAEKLLVRLQALQPDNPDVKKLQREVDKL